MLGLAIDYDFQAVNLFGNFFFFFNFNKLRISKIL